jgi:hypothetical protein
MPTVHQFEVWNIVKGDWVSSPTKATEDFIKIAKGRPIPGTAEDVAEKDIDAEGRYHPSTPA